MAYNPNILRDILRARSLTRTQLSSRLGVGRGYLDAALSGTPEPKQSVLNDIAKELALPPFVFYMQEAPALEDVLPDFRSETPAPSAKSRSTIESIQFAASVQRIASESEAPPADGLPNFTARRRANVEAFSLEAREFFGISVEDQSAASNAGMFYTLCRRKIEDKGIFVLHDSFPEEDGSGFCLANDAYPIIVINTKKQTRGRRLFTLIHELGHVLMHQSGISDPFVGNNSVERLCNRFAASFLIPEQYIHELLGNVAVGSQPALEDVARISRKLKISQQATALRLEELSIFRAGTYDNWLTAIHNSGNPDFSERGGGRGGPPPQEKVKLAKYGFHFANIFSGLLDQNLITEIGIFRATGLKPKFQHDYFDYVKSLTADELQNLELDDAG